MLYLKTRTRHAQGEKATQSQDHGKCNVYSYSRGKMHKANNGISMIKFPKP